MICDAHIHVGYYDRKCRTAPFYYSPRRICSVLRRCGVGAFVFSSTSMQTHGIVFSDVHKEAHEVVRLWGAGAYPFLWITKSYLGYDPRLSCLDEGLYKGFKLHGRETPWLSRQYTGTLSRVLDSAEERQLPVVVHTGSDAASSPIKWLEWAKRYNGLRFDFAHCYDADTAKTCFDEAENVFVDVSCAQESNIRQLACVARKQHILWGSDFPALSSRSGGSLMRDMRESCERYYRWSRQFDFENAFRHFLVGDCR